MFKRLKEDIRCVLQRDPAARNAVEVLTIYPGLHALLIYRFCHWLWMANCKWLARFISGIGRWLTGIEIHPAAKIGRRFFIDHGMGVVIGETTVIGNDCTIYHGVTLGGTVSDKGKDHPGNQGKRHPTLENNVVIGAGAKILGPVTIGAGARISANSVVIKNVGAQAKIMGIPGREMVLEPQVDHEKRHRMTERMGFDAYGVVENMRDPIAHAITSMLDHMHCVDQQVACLKQALKQLGVDVPEVTVKELLLAEFALDSENHTQTKV